MSTIVSKPINERELETLGDKELKMAITTNTAAVFERARRTFGTYLLSRPTRAAAHEVNHLHQLEHVGESEWTPWIAIAGLILFLAAIGLLMFGIVDAAFRVLMSASSSG
jgi:hypothetical protein